MSERFGFCDDCYSTVYEISPILHSMWSGFCLDYTESEKWLDAQRELFGNPEAFDYNLWKLENMNFIITHESGDKIWVLPNFIHHDGVIVFCSSIKKESLKR